MAKIRFILLSMLAVCLVSCAHREGPFERAGERVDEMSENVSEGDSIFHKKGPAEELGEAVDDATDDDRY